MIKQVILETNCGCFRLQILPEELQSRRVPLKQDLTAETIYEVSRPAINYREFAHKGKYLEIGNSQIEIFKEVSP